MYNTNLSNSVGDELHMVFEYAFLQHHETQYIMQTCFQTMSKQYVSVSVRQTLQASWALFCPV